MNRFKRIRDLFRKPGMVGTPPSARSMWYDPAAHARDFAQRYAEALDYSATRRVISPECSGMVSGSAGFEPFLPPRPPFFREPEHRFRATSPCGDRDHDPGCRQFAVGSSVRL